MHLDSALINDTLLDGRCLYDDTSVEIYCKASEQNIESPIIELSGSVMGRGGVGNFLNDSDTYRYFNPQQSADLLSITYSGGGFCRSMTLLYIVQRKVFICSS
jgi:hypothetical protein